VKYQLVVVIPFASSLVIIQAGREIEHGNDLLVIKKSYIETVVPLIEQTSAAFVEFAFYVAAPDPPVLAGK
jgi:hypothetical protein